MPIILRQATAADVQALAHLIEIVWPDTTRVDAYIARSIDASDHVACVADDAGTLVGLAAGFVTTTPSALRRWEVDLLAVHPSYRGQRLGERLVQASSEAGSLHHVHMMRGLVQIMNVASQRTFARSGYTLDPTVLRLCISSQPDVGPTTLPPHAYLIPVQTFTYRGLWLEGDVSVEALGAAQAACATGDWDTVGALIPALQGDDEDALPAPGYSVVDRYQWWERTVGS